MGCLIKYWCNCELKWEKDTEPPITCSQHGDGVARVEPLPEPEPELEVEEIVEEVTPPEAEESVEEGAEKKEEPAARKPPPLKPKIGNTKKK